MHNILLFRFQRPSAFRVLNDWGYRTQLSLTLQAHTTALDSTTIKRGTCTEQSLEDSF